MDTLNRNIYGRLFRGAYQEIADPVPSSLIGSVFDKTNMPALVLEPGKSVYYDFTLDQNESATLSLPQNYDPLFPLYIAVRSDLNARITFTSPTYGTGKIVLLKATDSATDGTHGAFWSFQGDMTTFAISIPSTGDGGATTSVQVFMYEIPDLSDFQSYFDRQIGLGVSGDV